MKLERERISGARGGGIRADSGASDAARVGELLADCREAGALLGACVRTVRARSPSTLKPK